MPKCTNCGQPTRRTEDWACQWCGYPVLSKSYRKIPKTYKQLKEERLHKPESQLREEILPETESHLLEDTAATKIELTVRELFSVCEAGTEVAAARFKNRILSVTGVVAGVVVEDDGDIYYVSLTSAQNKGECNVNCMFDRKNSSELNLLTEGQTVTIEGKYDSYELDILIRDCVLVRSPTAVTTPSPLTANDTVTPPAYTPESELEPVLKCEVMLGPEPKPAAEPVAGLELAAEPEPEPVAEPGPELTPEPEPELTSTAIEVTVGELLAAYAMDEAAADIKFGDKVLKVTGIVNRIEVKDYLDFDYINLTSANNSRLDHVRCFFDKKHGPELNQLTTGHEVTAQGTYNGSIINMRLRGCVLVSSNIY